MPIYLSKSRPVSISTLSYILKDINYRMLVTIIYVLFFIFFIINKLTLKQITFLFNVINNSFQIIIFYCSALSFKPVVFGAFYSICIYNLKLICVYLLFLRGSLSTSTITISVLTCLPESS